MLYAIIVALILIADQGLKYWVTLHVALNEGRETLIPGVLDLMNIHNYGIAFSLLQNLPSWIWALVALAFSVLVIVALHRNWIRGRFGRWMAVLVLAGAIGNLIDRVLSGYVVDMLSFAFWPSFPVFNLADAFLVVGVIAFCLYVFFHKDDAAPQAKKTPAAKAEKAAAPQAANSAAKKPAKPQPEKPARQAPAASDLNDDPFAAWDRAVSEQDAKAKADLERKAARKAAPSAQAARGAEQKQRAEDDKPAVELPPKQPAHDTAPTKAFTAPAAAATETAEDDFDLEAILREFGS